MHESQPECPVCHYIKTCPWELSWDAGLDADAEWDCPSCGTRLLVRRHVSCDYSVATLLPPVPVPAPAGRPDQASIRFTPGALEDFCDYLANDPALIAAAAEASEVFGDDDLEAFAAELRASRSGGAM
jgi:hypothetical protein